ncbi:hypothetical protein DPMN_144014 [Dreissena polymorpha]|uniref:Uncharacterized protein n=1 Tax=Dreissena polymorpha TaxID=45954 RepID=A0A9D4GDW4_DREPO|nr:hypothetical protein DPMN_144014 [Dreissena polymorpha]
MLRPRIMKLQSGAIGGIVFLTNTSLFMPPFEEEGVYCFAHVGLSVGRSMTPIDFEVTRSKVKVTEQRLVAVAAKVAVPRQQTSITPATSPDQEQETNVCITGGWKKSLPKADHQ